MKEVAYTFTVKVVRKQPAATLFELDADRKHWVPRCLVLEGDELREGETGEILVDGWFCEKEGLEP